MLLHMSLQFSRFLRTIGIAWQCADFTVLMHLSFSLVCYLFGSQA